MRILYETEGTSTYCVSYGAELDGYIHEELWHCDIDPGLGGYFVRFQDDYSNPIHFSTLLEAKTYVEKNYFKHKPLSQGCKTFIK